MSMPVPPLTAISLADPDSELLRTICRVCDGQATRADMDRLEQRLADPAAVTLYLAIRELDATLIWKNRWRRPWQPPQLAAAAAGSQSKRPTCVDRLESAFDRVATVVGTSLLSLGHRLGSRAGIAVLLTLTVGLGLAAAWQAGLVAEPALRLIKTVFERQPPRLPGSVACVTALHAATWASNDDAAQPAEPPTRFASLFPGQWFDLEAGLVEISFDGGAVALVEGPTRFRIAAAGACRLEQGRLTATLDKAAARAAGAQARFAVETPTATVTDLGTSFGVAVGAAGETDVSVFDGLVELLPRLAGAATTTGQPLRLAAGESAGVAPDRTAKRDAGKKRIAFTRTIPGEAARQPASSLPVAWDESQAVAVFYDPFAGAGGLAGSTPAARGGVGEAAWLAPVGWQLDAAAGGLAAASAGAALLPFTPQPGHRYRLAVTIEILDGGFGWASLGFADSADPRQPTLSYAWRPDTVPAESAATARRGPTAADRLHGIQTRQIILDTTGQQWRLFSLADDRLVGEQAFEPSATTISQVAVSVFPNTTAVLRGFSLQAVQRTR